MNQTQENDTHRLAVETLSRVVMEQAAIIRQLTEPGPDTSGSLRSIVERLAPALAMMIESYAKPREVRQMMAPLPPMQVLRMPRMGAAERIVRAALDAEMAKLDEELSQKLAEHRTKVAALKATFEPRIVRARAEDRTDVEDYAGEAEGFEDGPFDFSMPSPVPPHSVGGSCGVSSL